ncbi:MAG: ABC transporter ATP-binding protein [Anaerolineales bacterium]
MIETHDLSKQFHNFMAVDGVSLSVSAGKILALLGQNGAGKTTTVRMLTALLAPTRGWARVAGYDVSTRGHDVRAAVGVLTEQHGLYMRMNAFEYLDFFGRVYQLSAAARKKRSEQLLDYFGLTEAASRRIGEYSKGMRQKLALARAMVHDPAVLLLDEPTSAMDPEAARLVRDEIMRLKSSQRAIVICSHNLAEVEALADQIAIIYRGKILMQGTLNELKQNTLGAPEYEIQFSKPNPARGVSLPEGVETLAQHEMGLTLRIPNPQEANPQILRALAGSSVEVMAFQELPRSLEQAYLKVMSDVKGGEHVS